MNPFHARVRRLILTNFRSYGYCKLDFNSPFIGFVGDNGVGKTNLLEALSLLSPGRGLRNAKLLEINRLGGDLTSGGLGGWSVYVDLELPHGDVSIGTGLMTFGMDPQSGDKRSLRIDQKDISSQTRLEEMVSVVWMTPAMDGLLGEGPSARRRFLDKLVSGFMPFHRRHLYRYEQALRERSHLLREGRKDHSWLKTLEETVAQEGVAVTLARLEIVQGLNESMGQQKSPFPTARLTLNGWIETALANSPALHVEEMFLQKLFESRDEVSYDTKENVGPHCTDLEVIHNEKNHTIGLCSMGEQKAMLISILLAHMTMLVLKRNQTPLFLFDEGFVHLDERRRTYLREALRDLNIQTFFTAADKASVQGLMQEGDALFEIQQKEHMSAGAVVRKCAG